MRRYYRVDDLAGVNLRDIASQLLDDEFGNDGQAAVALQDAGYVIQDVPVYPGDDNDEKEK